MEYVKRDSSMDDLLVDLHVYQPLIAIHFI